jgi:hypothetical protein
MDCAICQGNIIDKVQMTCGAAHSYCFKCILKNIEVTKELQPCALCRGGDKVIFMLPDNQDPLNISSENDFYSIKYFTKSRPILNKIIGESETSSCLLSEKILLTYLKNRKQIEITAKLIECGYKLEDIYAIIKWNGIGSEIENDDWGDIGTFIDSFANNSGRYYTVGGTVNYPNIIRNIFGPPPPQR